MARKRPHLVPIYDSVIASTLQVRGAFWQPMYELLSEIDFRDRLTRIREEAGSRTEVRLPKGLSLLRVFDVIAWMDGKLGAGAAAPEGWDEEPLTAED